MNTKTVKRLFSIATFVLVALPVSTALGQAPPGAGPHPGMGPHLDPHPGMGPGVPDDGGPGEEGPDPMRHEMMRYLYPVHLVRRHAAELGLSDSQYEKLRAEVTRAKGEVEQLRWDLDREAQKLLQLVAKNASLQQVYAQMDRVFQYENEIKKKHLGLLVSVRGILNERQRQQLDKIKAERGLGGGPGWRRGEPRGKPGARGKR